MRDYEMKHGEQRREERQQLRDRQKEKSCYFTFNFTPEIRSGVIFLNIPSQRERTCAERKGKM